KLLDILTTLIIAVTTDKLYLCDLTPINKVWLSVTYPGHTGKPATSILNSPFSIDMGVSVFITEMVTGAASTHLFNAAFSIS
ncbi:hypothetical protein CWC15_22060, partial [Pseudoalteromonas spongiae]